MSVAVTLPLGWCFFKALIKHYSPVGWRIVVSSLIFGSFAHLFVLFFAIKLYNAGYLSIIGTTAWIIGGMFGGMWAGLRRGRGTRKVKV